MTSPFKVVTPSAKTCLKSLLLTSSALASFLSLSVANTSASAADRILQVLGRCGLADAQFIGNRKHGSIQLISFAPDGDAGVVVEGLEGKTISELKNIGMEFEPPQGENVSTFILRVSVLNPGQPNKIQRFSIGPDFNPNLPNIPSRDENGDATKQFVSVSRNALLQENSRLKGTDVIEKVSFIFSARKKNTRVVQYIDDVLYNGFPVYPLLTPITCNLK